MAAVDALGCHAVVCTNNVDGGGDSAVLITGDKDVGIPLLLVDSSAAIVVVVIPADGGDGGGVAVGGFANCVEPSVGGEGEPPAWMTTSSGRKIKAALMARPSATNQKHARLVSVLLLGCVSW
jgi:hypothetical protein